MSEGAELKFIYGPMESGKSALIVQQVYNMRKKGHGVVVAKPETDTKDPDIVSRAGNLRLPVDVIVPSTADIRTMLMGHVATRNLQPRLIVTDESQFFTAQQVEGLWEMSKRDGIPVDAYGLRTDFQGQLFQGSQRLFELADTLEPLTTQICGCGNTPNFNIRLFRGQPVFAGEQVAIDGAEEDITYETVCGECFLKERDKFEILMAAQARMQES